MILWPEWWSWEIEISPHMLKRMSDRGFTEVDLRVMMESATGYHEDEEPGRWVVETRHDSRPWEIIVEPDREDRVLVVVTAFAVEQP